jgi:hypothetical protein
MFFTINWSRPMIECATFETKNKWYIAYIGMSK